MYRLILSGGLTLEGPSGPLTGRIVQRSQLALLALLSQESSLPLTREKAIGLLWPEHTEDRARARLSDVVYVIRKELGEDVVLSVGDALHLNGDRLTCDVDEFEAAADVGRWEEAVEYYDGPFLDGVHLDNGAAFERWVEGRRRQLEVQYQECLEALAEEAEGEGDWRRAVTWWRRRAGQEPTNSRVSLRLMQALARAGNAPGALEHARIHELLLEDRLGVSLPDGIRSLARELEAGTGSWPAGSSRQIRQRADRPDAEAGATRREPGVESAQTEEGHRTAGSRGARRSLVGVATIVLVAVGTAGAWISTALGAAEDETILEEVLPGIEELVSQGLYDSAWALAREAGSVVPDSPELARLLPQFTWLWPELRTDPPGARVLYRPYGETDVSWEELGTTTLDPFRLPLGATVLRLERDGYRPVHMVPDDYLEEFPVFHLDPPDRLPEAMVRIPGWQVSIEGQTVELEDFFMGRYPVTNQEYLEFVEAGAYQTPDYWQHPFTLDGDTVAWEEAMAAFTDRTGRPGPSTWEVGRYPEGQGEYPVGGVSWYEAAAYAAFAGRSLPSVHHWRRAYGSRFFDEHLLPVSNLHSEGPTPVRSSVAMGPFGTFDMAGNVREWTHNGRGEARFILGAGWDDPEKLASDRFYIQPSSDRSPANGIRLAQYFEEGEALDLALSPLEPRPVPDFFAEADPPSDGQFQVFRRMYAYDSLPLNSRFETADTARHWVRETIGFDAAYGGERVLLHLYLPRDVAPPYQTVVYWPGASALTFRSVDQKTAVHQGFMVQSGRAFAFPVLKGTLERRLDREDVRFPWESVRHRDQTIQRVQDIMRTLDYLETREDVDTGSLAYLGWSWGGAEAPLVLALEDRFQAAILHVGGLRSVRPLPEADPLQYLSRVELPVLMLNGDRDTSRPVETHAEPFFHLLGTAPEHRRFVVAESGHFVTRPLLIRESLDWLDRYLGPPGQD